MIAERQYKVADKLPGLMALARDQQRISRLQTSDRDADRLRAVANFPGALRRTENSRSDRRWILAARIVVGNDDAVGMLGRDRAHQGTLAGIAVATGAEHHDELALGVRPQRLQRLASASGLCA